MLFGIVISGDHLRVSVEHGGGFVAHLDHALCSHHGVEEASSAGNLHVHGLGDALFECAQGIVSSVELLVQVGEECVVLCLDQVFHAILVDKPPFPVVVVEGLPDGLVIAEVLVCFPDEHADFEPVFGDAHFLEVEREVRPCIGSSVLLQPMGDVANLLINLLFVHGYGLNATVYGLTY